MFSLLYRYMLNVMTTLSKITFHITPSTKEVIALFKELYHSYFLKFLNTEKFINYSLIIIWMRALVSTISVYVSLYETQVKCIYRSIF